MHRREYAYQWAVLFSLCTVHRAPCSLLRFDPRQYAKSLGILLPVLCRSAQLSQCVIGSSCGKGTQASTFGDGFDAFLFFVGDAGPRLLATNNIYIQLYIFKA